MGVSFRFHQEPVNSVGCLFAFGVQRCAVVTERMAAGSLHNVVAFDVVSFGTLVVVVIPLRIIRSLGMPRAFVTHKSPLN